MNDYGSPITVTVDAPARLHFGFTDLDGGLGRRFGSLGLTLDGLSTRLQVHEAGTFSASGRGAGQALRWAESMLERLGLNSAVHIDVVAAIPEHAGLGSGTQLALAVGTALNRVLDLGLDSPRLARLLGRGARSGIGIGAFDHGGFLVDGGKGSSDEPPPVTARFEFPPHWRVLLLFDRHAKGLHGRGETLAFSNLPACSDAQSGALCRLVMMKILPSLAEVDWVPFAQGVGELQDIVGDHFAAAQGGRYTSDAVAEVLAWCRTQGFEGIGQSSWGPTGFVVVDSETRAHALLREVERRFVGRGLTWQVAGGRNRGAEIKSLDCGNRQLNA
ncbi:MAG: GHMP kinase [Gammaproteobacteria bacterium]|nr:GHMP kinase [Gammaproteobacteria bacterium]